MRWIGCGLAVVALTACGSRSGGVTIDRVFDVDWHDRANAHDIRYSVRHIVLREGRWSARVTIHNASGTPLYEAPWSRGFVAWNGPSLVFSGVDVLGNRRLIYYPADREAPRIPLPLANGATWRGTVGGKLLDEPALPHDSPIWVHYPTFGLGRVWDGFTPSDAVQWISAKGFEL